MLRADSRRELAREAVLTEQALERFAVKPCLLRRLIEISAIPREETREVVALCVATQLAERHRLDRSAEGRGKWRRRPAARSYVIESVERFSCELGSRSHRGGAPHHVAELPDVPRPRLLAEVFQRFDAERTRGAIELTEDAG